MTRFKHVLILIILVIPMFALAPSLIARPNEVLSNPTEVDIALPAHFVQESLRVAVYVEENTSLPSYATGGVYTNYSANVINLLESADYTVTALTTQDILDHKLMIADFDAFVLPNQLPRESIINFVKDYWLGGGGILSFDGSIGFCFYAGFIDESLEGNFELVPPATPGYWTYTDMIDTVVVNQSHPVTKAYEVDDEFLVPPGDVVILNGVDLPSIVGDRMINLVTWNFSSLLPVVAAFENPDRGGKIVQIAGNCSSFASWQSQTAIDAIDWLAPRPKGRILYDLTHNPNYGIDSWDSVFTQNTLTQTGMRDMLVNRSYTLDKLYPPSTLSTQNLEAYDILVISDPDTNFTAAEVAAVTEWVNEGGSILAIADYDLS
ncbi:MAG: hypothetical protein KAU48_11715, partial [Candidatus Thorarchaeota archaeon]|nr:hypothetical protein [Candidatus Thorarchaeota archaeon]